MGLNCATIVHVSDEIYGRFLLLVLHDEGISMVRMNEEIDADCSSNAEDETLLGWVLVDPFQIMGFGVEQISMLILYLVG